MATEFLRERRLLHITISVIVLSILLAAGIAHAGNGPEGTAPPVVYVVPVKGEIEPGLAEFIRRGLKEAENQRASAVIMEIDTFGGRVDAATEIRDSVLKMSIPVVAFVEERAWSAGALIALSAGKIIMTPGSSIGAAEPRPAEEKTISALRAEFESTAESTGRDPKIAGAMVDKDIEIDGLVDSGKILTLPAAKALELGYADAVAGRRLEVLDEIGLSGARVIELEPNWAERTARFLTGPTVSSLLLTLGFLGLLVEFFVPGWGLGGTVGVAALALFFGGRLIAGLAGWEAILLFLAGVLLLGVELLVIPGFGVAGIAGLVAVFGSIYLSFATSEAAAYSMTLSLVLTLVLGTILVRHFGKSGAWNRLILGTSQKKEQGYVAPVTLDEFAGKTGRALTTLRPAGTIIVDDNRLDAITEGGFIQAGAPVKIVKIEGSKIVVRKLSDPS